MQSVQIAASEIWVTLIFGVIMWLFRSELKQKKGYTTYEFTIKDNGIGMSSEFLGHVFDTFAIEQSSTVRGIQGTGLGMAITKNIVDMIGGTIEVESEEGKGSKFTVTLTVRFAKQTVRYEQRDSYLAE